jgi:flagellar basal-body rod protein FlgB
MKLYFDRMLDSTTQGLERTLDLTWQRNNAISTNIANAETPKYRAVDIDFGGELDRAFKRSNQSMLKTNAKHMDLSSVQSAQVVPDLSGATKPDGNNVDIDIQMGELAFNSGKYAGAVRFLRKKLGMLRFAIREAGR